MERNEEDELSSRAGAANKINSKELDRVIE